MGQPRMIEEVELLHRKLMWAGAPRERTCPSVGTIGMSIHTAMTDGARTMMSHAHAVQPVQHNTACNPVLPTIYHHIQASQHGLLLLRRGRVQQHCFRMQAMALNGQRCLQLSG